MNKVVAALVVLGLMACEGQGLRNRESGALGGAALGAGLGAIVGHAVGRTGEGIAIGAGAGALSGAAIGNAQDSNEDQMHTQEEVLERQEEEIRRQRREVEDLKRQQYHNDRFKRYDQDVEPDSDSDRRDDSFAY